MTRREEEYIQSWLARTFARRVELTTVFDSLADRFDVIRPPCSFDRYEIAQASVDLLRQAVAEFKRFVDELPDFARLDSPVAATLDDKEVGA